MAIIFNGTNYLAQIQTNYTAVTGVPFFISAWINPNNDIAASRRSIVQLNSGGLNSQYSFFRTTDQRIGVDTRSSNGSTSATLSSSSLISTSGWNHVCCAFYSLTHREVYLNGQVTSGNIAINGSPTGIIRIYVATNYQATAGTQQFRGSISELSIWRPIMSNTMDNLRSVPLSLYSGIPPYYIYSGISTLIAYHPFGGLFGSSTVADIWKGNLLDRYNQPIRTGLVPESGSMFYGHNYIISYS